MPPRRAAYADSQQRRETLTNAGWERRDVELDPLSLDALRVLRDTGHRSDNAAVRAALVEAAAHALLDHDADRAEPPTQDAFQELAREIVFQLVDDRQHMGLEWLRLPEEMRSRIERRWTDFVARRLRARVSFPPR